MPTIVTYERLKDRIGKTIYFMCKNRIQEAKITQAFETLYKTPWCRLEYEIKTNIRGWEPFDRKVRTNTIFTDRVIIADSPEQVAADLLGHYSVGNIHLTTDQDNS